MITSLERKLSPPQSWLRRHRERDIGISAWISYDEEIFPRSRNNVIRYESFDPTQISFPAKDPLRDFYCRGMCRVPLWIWHLNDVIYGNTSIYCTVKKHENNFDSWDAFKFASKAPYDNSLIIVFFSSKKLTKYIFSIFDNINFYVFKFKKYKSMYNINFILIKLNKNTKLYINLSCLPLNWEKNFLSLIWTIINKIIVNKK